MGVGVIFKSAKVNNPGNGDLDMEACQAAAQRALASAKELLEQEGVPYEVGHFNFQAKDGGRCTAFGFALTMLGYAQGSMDLVYQWEKFPGGTKPDKIHRGCYAKSQFAADPDRAHILMCKILRKWKDEELVTRIWDDLGYLEHQDPEVAAQGMADFNTGLNQLFQAFEDSGARVIRGG